ncbi:hypothetical protein SAMN05661012_04797 [Chitinophaga sancti]|uniref:Uncharacterized protein n=1 Tax=Chitinophaga sancti TaxID=1004 RepID=A0A1K1S5C4_9BACT|nr:hypothetical protein SAMN05661012_04797 [Chitinophaga sancti]
MTTADILKIGNSFVEVSDVIDSFEEPGIGPVWVQPVYAVIVGAADKKFVFVILHGYNGYFKNWQLLRRS